MIRIASHPTLIMAFAARRYKTGSLQIEAGLMSNLSLRKSNTHINLLVEVIADHSAYDVLFKKESTKSISESTRFEVEE